MKILSNAILHADRKYSASAFGISPKISNCLVPWYITHTSEQRKVFDHKEIRKLDRMFPSTSQLTRSLSVSLFTINDWRRLIQSEFVRRISPTLKSLIINFDDNNNNNTSANVPPLRAVTGEEIVNFIRRFSNLSHCLIGFSRSCVNWQEVASLFGRVFDTRSSNTTAVFSNNTAGASNNAARASNNAGGASNNAGGASNNTAGAFLLSMDVTFSLVKSLIFLLDDFNTSSPPPSAEDCKKIVLAFTHYQIVPKLQAVMEAMFYSNNLALNDGKSLPHFVQLLTNIFQLKKKALPPVATSTPEEQQQLQSFMSVAEMKVTFDRLHTLLMNGDFMRDGTGVLLSQVVDLIGICFVNPTADVNVIDPEKADFMKRYGRDMLPELFEQITKFKQEYTKATGNKNPPRHMHHDASSFLLFSMCTFINDAYWYDGDLETVEDVRRMIDIDRRKVLAHFPFEVILSLLNEDNLDERLIHGILSCVESATRYLARNRLLINAKENDCVEFVEKYNLPVKIAERLILELDTNASGEVGYSKTNIVTGLWACIGASCAMARSLSLSFTKRNKTSLVGSKNNNFLEFNQYVSPLIEKTFAFVDHTVEVMSARIINDGFSVNLERQVVKSLKVIKTLSDVMTRTSLHFLRKIHNELRGDNDEKTLTEAECSLLEKTKPVCVKLLSFESDCEKKKKNVESQLEQAKKQQGTRESGVRREREDED